MKRSICALFLGFLTYAGSFAFDKPFFSGYAGFQTNLQNASDSSLLNKNVTAETFFSGQLDFSGKVFLRGEFYVLSAEMTNSNILSGYEDANAYFRLEDISATLKTNSTNASHYISVFMGNYEPIGSDLFLQRQFGIEPISSAFTTSWQGIEGSSIIPSYQTGVSYVYHPQSNYALEFKGYKNSSDENSIAGGLSTNHTDGIDFAGRYAALFDRATVDLQLSVDLPLEKKDANGDDVFLLIKKIRLNGGFSLLLGNRYTTSLFLQGGYEGYVINGDSSDKEFSIKNVYAFSESRFSTSRFNMGVAVFNIPVKSAVSMTYLKNIVYENPSAESIFGANVNIYSDKLYFDSTNYTLGIHATWVMTDDDAETLLDNRSQIAEKLLHEFKLTPYTSINILGGSLSASVTLNCYDLITDFSHSISGNIGFKTSF